MLKALALTAIPFLTQSAAQDPWLIHADEPLTLEMVQKIMLLVQHDDTSERRQEFLREQLEITGKLRDARQQLQDTKGVLNRAVEDLELRLAQARTALDGAQKPSKDQTPAHSLRQAYETLRRNWSALNKETGDARKNRTQLLNQAEALVAELERELASNKESSQRYEERARIEARVKRYLADQWTARLETLQDDRSTPRPILHDDFGAARIAAAVAGKPLLVNFSAHTCINCRMMEAEVFPAPEVSAALGQFVEARLHSDTKDAALRGEIEERAMALVGSTALPAYVALDPRTGKVLGLFMGASRDRASFASFLSSSLEKLGGPQPAATDAELWRCIFELEEQVTRLQAEAKKAAGSNW